MNTGQFAGHLGRDGELRSTPSGQSVVNFSVAVAVGFGDKERTLWVSCALWGERAEKLAPYLTKGKAVSVAGDVDIKTYETRDGKHGAELTLNVQRVTLQGGKDDRQRTAPASGGSKPAETTGQPAQREEFDDDIPF